MGTMAQQHFCSWRYIFITCFLQFHGAALYNHDIIWSVISTSHFTFCLKVLEDKALPGELPTLSKSTDFRTTRNKMRRPKTMAVMSLATLSSRTLLRIRQRKVAETRRRRPPSKYTPGTGALGHKGKGKRRLRWRWLVGSYYMVFLYCHYFGWLESVVTCRDYYAVTIWDSMTF